MLVAWVPPTIPFIHSFIRLWVIWITILVRRTNPYCLRCACGNWELSRVDLLPTRINTWNCFRSVNMEVTAFVSSRETVRYRLDAIVISSRREPNELWTLYSSLAAARSTHANRFFFHFNHIRKTNNNNNINVHCCSTIIFFFIAMHLSRPSRHTGFNCVAHEFVR